MYSVGERVFRTAVFHNGVAEGAFERRLILFIEFFRQQTCSPNVLSAGRAERGLALWKRLGAEVFRVTPEDRQAQIHGVHWKASALEREIVKRGGKWEKVVIDDGRSLIVIFPPEGEHKASEGVSTWEDFEGDLAKFRWVRQTISIGGRERSVIVTCHEAAEIDPQEKRLFLHSNSASVSFIMLTGRVGFYLGMKSDLCFYDPRGTWKSSGIASEGGYYNDIAAVYEQFKAGYRAEQIWVSGACGGCNAAAHLKARTRAGFHLILENGFADLARDFIAYEGCLVQAYTKRFWGGLAAKDFISSYETGFSIEKMFERLKSLPGRVIVVGVENDQRLPPVVRYRNLVTVSRISEHVFPVFFHSNQVDTHSDRYYNHSEGRARVISAFKAPSQELSLAPPPVVIKRSNASKIILAVILIATIVFCIYRLHGLSRGPQSF